MKALFEFVSGFVDFVVIVLIYAFVILLMFAIVLIFSPVLAYLMAKELIENRGRASNVKPKSRQ